ncbi:MAG TPA: glycosyltransferase family 4 protein [Gaiellales bacterium]
MSAGSDTRSLHVALIDPSGYSRPYDHELATALAARGHRVTLWSSRFVHGPAPEAVDYTVIEHFYRRSNRMRVGSRLRAPAKAFEHVAGLAGMRRALRRSRPDVVHVQWTVLRPVERPFYRRLAAAGLPVVFTAHDPLPNVGGPARRRSFAATARSFERVICHSEWGRRALVQSCGVDPGRVRVVAHGAFTYLRDAPQVPSPVAAAGPLAVLPGILRPYKGADVLVRAWPAVRDLVPEARLVVAGRAMMDVAALGTPGAGVEILDRFLPDAELAALLRRAEVVVLPYRRIDSSGVLFAALAFGRAVVLSDVGSFRELHDEHGIGVLVPPDDAGALASAVAGVLEDDAGRADLEAASRRAADGPFAWEAVARRHEEIYRELVR